SACADHVTVTTNSPVSQVYADRLYLQSFPTRRSSDLVHDSTGLAEDGRTAARTALRFGDPAGVLLLPLPRQGRGRHGRRRHPGLDRKSTRLNSSHVKISYAVFCLKKKKRE